MRKLLLSLFLFVGVVSLFSLHAQNTWIQKANYGGGNRAGAIGFAIGNTGYILCGNDTGIYDTDMWAWSTEVNEWKAMAPFMGGQRLGISCVSLNGYAYVIGGGRPSNCFLKVDGGVCSRGFYKDIWRYNPDSNIWTSFDTAFPGSLRDFAIAVADPDNATIYYGTGNDANNVYLNDWWSLKISTHVWRHLKNFPGGQRINAVGFFLNGNVYVGTGDNNDPTYNASNDFWEYKTASNTWKKVASIPGVPVRCASAFTIGNYGYVCLGFNDSTYTNCGWRYDPVKNSWLQIANYAGSPKASGVAFAIGENGYIGTGAYGTSYFNDFWEYTSDSALGLPAPALPFSAYLYPNPASNSVSVSFSGITSLPAQLTIMDLLGNIVNSATINSANGQASVNVDNLNPGVYLYQITTSGKRLKAGKFIIAR